VTFLCKEKRVIFDITLLPISANEKERIKRLQAKDLTDAIPSFGIVSVFTYGRTLRMLSLVSG
jgi:hypothetical protein